MLHDGTNAVYSVYLLCELTGIEENGFLIQ